MAVLFSISLNMNLIKLEESALLLKVLKGLARL